MKKTYNLIRLKGDKNEKEHCDGFDAPPDYECDGGAMANEKCSAGGTR